MFVVPGEVPTRVRLAYAGFVAWAAGANAQSASMQNGSKREAYIGFIERRSALVLREWVVRARRSVRVGLRRLVRLRASLGA
ncbi:MAG: hypothetical protein KC492_03795 [Myxococcales bacterium]|nr:hypothetical protein [Myxococcales bacterium]